MFVGYCVCIAFMNFSVPPGVCTLIEAAFHYQLFSSQHSQHFGTSAGEVEGTGR